MDVVVDQTAKSGCKDVQWFRLLEAIWDLCPVHMDSEHYPGNPSEEADLVSEPPELLSTFQELLLTDSAKALDYIVNWFAGWAFMHSGSFRRFIICHEEHGPEDAKLGDSESRTTQQIKTSSQDWVMEYQHLIVQNPRQCLEKGIL